MARRPAFGFPVGPIDHLRSGAGRPYRERARASITSSAARGPHHLIETVQLVGRLGPCEQADHDHPHRAGHQQATCARQLISGWRSMRSRVPDAHSANQAAN